jgi:hypothetical protein
MRIPTVKSLAISVIHPHPCIPLVHDNEARIVQVLRLIVHASAAEVPVVAGGIGSCNDTAMSGILLSAILRFVILKNEHAVNSISMPLKRNIMK